MQISTLIKDHSPAENLDDAILINSFDPEGKSCPNLKFNDNMVCRFFIWVVSRLANTNSRLLLQWDFSINGCLYSVLQSLKKAFSIGRPILRFIKLSKFSLTYRPRSSLNPNFCYAICPLKLTYFWSYNTDLKSINQALFGYWRWKW